MNCDLIQIHQEPHLLSSDMDGNKKQDPKNITPPGHCDDLSAGSWGKKKHITMHR